jgi:hypothetical protein
MIDDTDRGERQLWLLIIGLCIGIVWIICRFPRTSLAVGAALGGAAALVRLGVV